MSFAGKLNRVNQFLLDVHKEEICVSRARSYAEMCDIGTAVNEMVTSIVRKAFGNDQLFSIPRKQLSRHVQGVGSFFEQTKIVDLDEFDYTILLPYFNESNIKAVKQLHTPYFACKHGVPKHSSAFVELEYIGRDKDILTEKELLTTIESKKYIIACGLHSLAKEMIDKCLSNDEHKVSPIDRDTGTLKINKTDFGNKLLANGPALKLCLKWLQKQGNRDLNITVDLVPAIRLNPTPDIFDNITAPVFMRNEIEHYGGCCLIPKNKPQLSVDFLISFSQIESAIIIKLKQENSPWFFCYIILKFIFWNDTKLTQFPSAHLFSSYVLKSLLLQEAFSCKERDITLVECLLRMLDTLQRYTDTSDVGLMDHIQVRSVWFMDSVIGCRSVNERFEKGELVIIHDVLEQIKNMLINIDRDCDYEYARYKMVFLDIVQSLSKELYNLNQERKSKYSQT
jgi:hypothetical protein